MKKHTTLKSKFNSAFSLVELLVVIAVIAIIAAIAIPNITGARESAEDGRWISDKESVNRRIQECAEATGYTPTIAEIVAVGGHTNTNRDTQTQMIFAVQTEFSADSLAEALPPSQR
jgi:prepilin-type N-terminal cleavage/methylation domain-containing protein